MIESFWGPLPFLLLYFAAGAAGGLAHHLSDPHGMIPLVGASGAIAGLMGAFLMGHPRSRIRVAYFFWLIRPYWGTAKIPAWTFFPAWLLMQLAFALLGRADGTAYWTHVGGFAVGVLGTFVLRRGGWITYDADEVLARSRSSASV